MSRLELYGEIRPTLLNDLLQVFLSPGFTADQNRPYLCGVGYARTTAEENERIETGRNEGDLIDLTIPPHSPITLPWLLDIEESADVARDSKESIDQASTDTSRDPEVAAPANEARIPSPCREDLTPLHQDGPANVSPTANAEQYDRGSVRLEPFLFYELYRKRYLSEDSPADVAVYSSDESECFSDIDSDEASDAEGMGVRISEHPSDCTCTRHAPLTQYPPSDTSSDDEEEEVESVPKPQSEPAKKRRGTARSIVSGIKTWIKSRRGKARAQPREGKLSRNFYKYLNSDSSVNLDETSDKEAVESSPRDLGLILDEAFHEGPGKIPSRDSKFNLDEISDKQSSKISSHGSGATEDGVRDEEATSNSPCDPPIGHEQSAAVHPPEENLDQPPRIHGCEEDLLGSSRDSTEQTQPPLLYPEAPTPPQAPPPAILVVSNNPPRPFQCTFCFAQCDSKDEWMKHEQSSHIRQQGWTCTLNSPMEEIDGQFLCIFCGVVVDSNHRMSQHNVERCAQLPIEQRTFTTQKDIQQHLHTIHSYTDSITTLRHAWEWPKVMDNWYWNCGFCDQLLKSWQERLDHIHDEHFAKQSNMASWNPRQTPYPLYRRTLLPVSGFPRWNPAKLLAIQQPSLPNHHPHAPLEGQKKFQCICGVKFTTFSGSNQHRKLWHESPRCWVCPLLSKFEELGIFFDPPYEDAVTNPGSVNEELETTASKGGSSGKKEIDSIEFCACCGEGSLPDEEIRREHLTRAHHFEGAEVGCGTHKFFQEDQFLAHLANVHNVQVDFLGDFARSCQREAKPPAMVEEPC